MADTIGNHSNGKAMRAMLLPALLTAAVFAVAILAGCGGEPADSEPFAAVSAGAGYTCGVRTDGSIVCWGIRAMVIPAGGGN